MGRPGVGVGVGGRNLAAVVTSDWHLAPGAWSSRPAIAGDAFHVLEQIMSLSLRLRVPVLAAGDLLDTRKPDAQTVAKMNWVLNESPITRILYIQGQHELSADPWLYAAGVSDERRVHVHCDTVQGSVNVLGDNVNLYGLDWRPSASLQDDLDRIDCFSAGGSKQVLMLHQVCVAAMVSNEYFQEPYNENRRAQWSVSPTGQESRDRAIERAMRVMPSQLNDYMLPDWVDLVVIGDTHRHAVFTLKKKSGEPVVCLSPGALAMQATNELSFGQVFLLYDDLSFESVKLETRPVIHLAINSEDDFDAAVKSVKQLCKTAEVPPDHLVPIVLVHIVTPNGEKWNKLQEAYRAADGRCYGHLFPLVTKQQANAGEEVSVDMDAVSVLSSADELIDYAVQEAAAEDPVVKELVLKLLHAPSPDMALSEEWQKHLERYEHAAT